MDWQEAYRAATAAAIDEPFWRCLAEALALVETGHGRARIETAEGLNEIGYKALAGHPSVRRATQEAEGADGLTRTAADFRLFADRGEQAHALAWLLRSSSYYETARLLFVLAFYTAYAPGRDDGARALVALFNALAREGRYPGVRPFGLTERGGGAAPALNHAAARRAVRLFAALTATPG